MSNNILEENERICANTDCFEVFTIKNNTIHCNKCDRWYCSDMACYVDCNDEPSKGYFKDTIINDIKTQCVDYCDNCEYGDSEDDKIEDKDFYNKFGFNRNEIKYKNGVKK